MLDNESGCGFRAEFVFVINTPPSKHVVNYSIARVSGNPSGWKRSGQIYWLLQPVFISRVMVWQRAGNLRYKKPKFRVSAVSARYERTTDSVSTHHELSRSNNQMKDPYIDMHESGEEY